MFNDMMHILTTQSGDIWTALRQHVTLSLIAIVIAAAIALPLAVALINRRRAGEFVLQIAGVIQTIPSLAILGALIPLVGIGSVPSVIALVLYAIMPIFQNAYAGLTGIDPALMEAADAFGLPKRFKLFRVQLPLAMPYIMSGIRIAMVMVIGTATLAALIGGGGLGTFIMLGIQTNNNAELLLGAVLSALLALVFSVGIRLLSKLSLKRLGVLLAVAFVVIGGFTGYRAVAQPKGTIVIAGKLGGEPEILINMYKDLIEADDPNLSVTLKPNFGGTSFIFKALQSHDVDIYPEFTGTVLQSLVKVDGDISHDPKKAYQQAATALETQYKMTLLEPMAYQNTYALAVRAETAKAYNLKTTSDLARISGQLSAGFDPDFYKLSDGYPGLQKAYGLNFGKVVTMESSLRYEAVANKQVDVTDAYTTDPQLKRDKLVSLTDDKQFFPPYQGAPLVNDDTLAKYPSIKTSLNKLAGRISTQDMIDMNYAVTVQHKKASVVAHDYLVAHDLLK
jgi:osmoprotectant transport system permease protein